MISQFARKYDEILYDYVYHKSIRKLFILNFWKCINVFNYYIHFNNKLSLHEGQTVY